MCSTKLRVPAGTLVHVSAGETGFVTACVYLSGRTGISVNRSKRQSYFFSQIAASRALSGEWPADQKEEARSLPPWHGVQPKVP